MDPKARRVTMWKADGLWFFKVQGMNWRTIDGSGGIGAPKRTVSAIVRRRYPGVEVVEAAA